MKLPLKFLIVFLVSISCLANSFTSLAQISPKPLWVQKGIKSLNDQRISTDYHFVAFHHEMTNDSIVPTDRIFLLRENLAKEFGVDSNLVTIDSIVSAGKPEIIYSVTFPKSGSDEFSRVYVKEVDSYSRYDNNIDGSFDYVLDELYAVSDIDITPVFDDFKVTRNYGALPVALSLIPGLGQIYKGQSAKGYSILGAEVVFCAAIAFGEVYRNYYLKKGDKDPMNYDSWKSKSNTFRAIRNVGIVFASATYLYNLLDAAFAKGAPHVVISPSDKKPLNLVFYPEACPNHLGIALSLTF